MHRTGVNHFRFTPRDDCISWVSIAVHYFSLAHGDVADKLIHEKLRKNPVFDSGGSDLHGNVRGGQAELQKDRQELSHERQQGM